jgi:putative salt-induced outer membrane protein YdiY
MKTLARAIVATLLLSATAFCQEGEAPRRPDPPAIEAPSAKPDQDFVVFKSGEVLLGETKRYWDGTLTFKSVAAGANLKLPFSNVATLYCAKPNTWVTTDLEELVGPGQIDEQLVTVETKDGERVFPREQLLRLQPGIPSELQYWSAHFHLGVSGTTGNTRQLTGLAKVDLRRESSISRLDMGYRGAYGISEQEEVVKSHEGLLEWRLFISRRFYLIPALGRVLYDKFQNIALRATGGAGAGYFLIRDAGLEWTLESGASYTYTEFRRTLAGEARTRTDAHARVATRLEWDLTDRITFKGNYEILIGLNDIESTLHQAEASVNVKILENLHLSLNVIWKRVERPVQRSDGSRPHHDDAKYSLGLTLDL